MGGTGFAFMKTYPSKPKSKGTEYVSYRSVVKLLCMVLINDIFHLNNHATLVCFFPI